MTEQNINDLSETTTARHLNWYKQLMSKKRFLPIRWKCVYSTEGCGLKSPPPPPTPTQELLLLGQPKSTWDSQRTEKLLRQVCQVILYNKFPFLDF